MGGTPRANRQARGGVAEGDHQRQLGRRQHHGRDAQPPRQQLRARTVNPKTVSLTPGAWNPNNTKSIMDAMHSRSDSSCAHARNAASHAGK